MPIYEYQCTRCGAIIEKIQKKPREWMPCPRCDYDAASYRIRLGSWTLSARRVMSSPTFRIKGFNAANGYNLPSKSDMLYPNGEAKKKWSRD